MRQLALSPSRPYVTAVEYPMVIVKPYAAGAASLPSQFINMSVSPSQPFDWIKEQSQDPELREIIALIKRKKLYPRIIKKGDSSVTKALLRVKGQLKLVKGVLYRRHFWTIVLKGNLGYNSFYLCI